MAPKVTRKVSRNPELIRGIGKYSRSQMYHKRGIWAIKAKNGGVLPRHDPKPKPETPAEKPPKFYPADDIKKPLVNKHKPKPAKLRASITPGTVLILLAGRFKGKRVVFLKQLPSGLLLVTGPFKVNGVPLRRVNQAYVIGTSTKVDISAVNVDSFGDKYFAKEAQKKKKKGEGEFFEAEKEEKSVLPQQKKDDQKTVDAAVLKAIESVPDLKSYLGARFSLKAGVKPHELEEAAMAPKITRKVSRNPELIRGIGKYSRSQMYHKRGIWAIKAKNGGVLPRHDPKPKPEAPAEKPPKFYPADDIKKPLVNKHKPKPAKLRASITPGTVLILLAGRFKGKRVVFLKQLPSGLLLVTGPFKINGVPLRRVNQSYVIGTSTKVDVSAVNVDQFDDKYFAKEAQKKKKKGEGEFFEAEKEEKSVLPQQKKDDQKTVDSALIKAIGSVPDLKTYLGARFSLKAGVKPHELVF
ncbi:60S ribosomal protein L6 [Glycine max]|nr:60S ribosomal protein L6 [Glycine max]